MVAAGACAGGNGEPPDASGATVTDAASGESRPPEDGPAGSADVRSETVPVDASLAAADATLPAERPARAAPAMTVTIDIAPSAVWEDGTPITADDFECSWRAASNTPGSIVAARYENVTAVRPGATERQVVVELGEVDAAYKTMFDRIIKAAAVADCDDVSGDFAGTMPITGGRWRVESWSPEAMTLVPNERHWGGDLPNVQRVVIVPLPDQATGALHGGLVDAVFPQFGDTLVPSLVRPDVAIGLGDRGDVEALDFQQFDGPFADPVFRAAFSRSIDRTALYATVYEPILSAAGAAGGVPTCGPMAEGPFCEAGTFAAPFDPAAADAMLTAAGWLRDESGYWAKEGVVPEIRFMINEGDVRRDQVQELLIASLAQAGFRVVADNCSAACVFDQRLPTLDYDMTMYTTSAPADPGSLTPRFTCASIPVAENNFAGDNVQGWCDDAASAALVEADGTVDAAERGELVRGALRAMAGDDVVLPLAALPTIGAWRIDRVGGSIGTGPGSDRPLGDLGEWSDVDGDGQIVIGAEGWPTCLNPYTSCAETPWYDWTIAASTLPGVWATGPDRRFHVTDLVTGEPVAEVAPS
jgi:peptide/nickel transport system substrate-binding protein